MCMLLMLSSTKPSTKCKDNVIIKVITNLNDVLEKRFFAHDVMDALGVVYPQYWFKSSCEVTFLVHMATLKGSYCPLKKLGSTQTWMPTILDVNILDSQPSFFKIKMMFNAQWAKSTS